MRFEPSRFTQPFDIQHHIVISSPLCVFLESKLNVQANMIEPNNGQASTAGADKYTGAIILRTRPHTYKRVVRLRSEGVRELVYCPLQFHERS